MISESIRSKPCLPSRGQALKFPAMMIATRLIAHVYDAGYWYNRNLVIIANIERQFLRPEDQRNIHFYFGSHRANNKMMMHLRIQFWLGIGIAGLVLFYHFTMRVWGSLT